jgi:hypothetical protein
MMRIGAFTWWLFKSAFFDTLLLLCVPLFLSIIFSLTDFFNSPFWLPYIFIALGIIGRTAWGLHQAMKDAPSRLTREEKLGIVGKYLRSSVLLAALLGMLFCFYYGSQQTTDPFLQSEELLPLGLVALVCIVGCLIFIGTWMDKGIQWLRSRRTSRRQTSRRAQSAPLQQQIHKRP